VIDALDECEREADIRAILQLLARTKDIHPMPLRIVVTSRPELHILAVCCTPALFIVCANIRYISFLSHITALSAVCPLFLISTPKKMSSFLCAPT
jgi:hypothetical protein